MKYSGHGIYLRPGFKPQLNWAVFLDRDGVINAEKHLVYKPEDFEFLPSSIEAIKRLNQLKVPVIVVHNAAAVARGLCSPEQVNKLNHLMLRKLKQAKAYLDAIFFCGHHPIAYDPRYLKNCSWRKPKPGMLHRAAKKFKLNLKQSFVIGDQARDILAGQRVAATTILVQTGHAGKDPLYQAKPDRTVADLAAAVNWILKTKKL